MQVRMVCLSSSTSKRLLKKAYIPTHLLQPRGECIPSAGFAFIRELLSKLATRAGWCPILGPIAEHSPIIPIAPKLDHPSAPVLTRAADPHIGGDLLHARQRRRRTPSPVVAPLGSRVTELRACRSQAAHFASNSQHSYPSARAFRMAARIWRVLRWADIWSGRIYCPGSYLLNHFPRNEHCAARNPPCPEPSHCGSEHHLPDRRSLSAPISECPRVDVEVGGAVHDVRRSGQGALPTVLALVKRLAISLPAFSSSIFARVASSRQSTRARLNTCSTSSFRQRQPSHRSHADNAGT